MNRNVRTVALVLLTTIAAASGCANRGGDGGALPPPTQGWDASGPGVGPGAVGVWCRRSSDCRTRLTARRRGPVAAAGRSLAP